MFNLNFSRHTLGIHGDRACVCVLPLRPLVGAGCLKQVDHLVREDELKEEFPFLETLLSNVRTGHTHNCSLDTQEAHLMLCLEGGREKRREEEM